MSRVPVVPLIAALLAAAVALSPSCPLPDPVLENDAGDAAWVQRATLLVWGRRAGSAAETAVLTDLVEQSDRASVVRAMTASPEYLDRWQDFLYDALAVTRMGARAGPTCWNVGLLGDDPGPELAAHILAAPASTSPPFEVPFTLRDVTRSALRLDDLSVLYRSALFPPLTTFFEPPNLLEAASERRELAEVFVLTHLDRNLTCVRCHNSAASVTDHPDPEEDRSWPLPGHVEEGVFGDDAGRDINDIAQFFRRRGVVHRFGFDDSPPPSLEFPDLDLDGCRAAPERPGCFDCPCEATVCDEDPSCCTDGWDAACAEACEAAPEECTAPIPERFDGCAGLSGGPGGCDGCACEAAVCEADPACCEENWDEFCALNCRERSAGCEWHEGRASADAHRPWGLSEECGLFEDPGALEDDITGESGWFVEDAGPAASVYDLDALLLAGAERVRSAGLRIEDDGGVRGDAAFAWLVGAAVADRVWKEAFGRRLTLSHNIPRNQAQRDRLMVLTTAFVRGGFSLQDLLVAVATDPVFNQRAPAEAEAEAPYYIERILDPWTVEEDDEGVRDNSAGDGVHQLPARVRVRAAVHALDWPEPVTFPAREDGPVARFYGGIGAFLKGSEPGFDAIGLQPMLAWELAMGRCEAPPLAASGACVPRPEPGCDGCECAPFVCARSPECCTEEWGPVCAEECRLLDQCGDPERGGDDWIDALVDALEEREAEGRPANWEQAVATLKGRLVGEPWVGSDAERAALEGLVGTRLSERVADPERPLRAVCGALLASPQFMLGGLPASPPPDPAPAPVIVPGTSYVDHCEALAADLFPGGGLDCSSGTAVLR